MRPACLTALALCTLSLFSFTKITTGQPGPKKTTPIVIWLPPLPIHEGEALGPAQLNAIATVPGTFVYTPPAGTVLPAGPKQTLSANFTPSDEGRYKAVNNIHVQITVLPDEIPKITWKNPADIAYGTPLGPDQLNAISDVPGIFVYDPPAGTILPVGAGQTLSVNFTPTDIINYKPIENTRVQLTVIPKLDPKVTWENPADITYGTPLSASQLNATSDVAGTFSYEPGVGTILDAGAAQTLTATFTPDNTIFYNSATKSVTINVNPATLSVTAGDATKVYGKPNPAFAITYSGFANGDGPNSLDTPPKATSTATVTTNAGTTVPITPAGGTDANYIFKYNNGVLTITKSTVVAKADNKTRRYGQANPVFTITYTGFANGESASVLDVLPTASTTALASSPAGNYPIKVSAGLDDNYNFTYAQGTLTITTSTAPSISDFQIVTNEDSKYIFDYRIFQQNFSGPSGDSIVSIKIVKPPVNGDLFWKGVRIVAGNNITVAHGQLVDFNYTPAADFNGRDTIVWNVSDGALAAAKNARITTYAIPVNDPPRLLNSESGTLTYRAGSPPDTLAANMIVEDPDNAFMTEARISVLTNLSGNDVLAVAGFSSPNLTTTWDGTTGMLTLSGMDSRANYEAALQHVVFSSPASAESPVYSKKLSFTINDGTDESSPVFITIQLDNYPELNIVNAFTPNQDGVNDYWDFVNLEYYSEVKVSVINQDGLHVFDCGSRDCKWDGTIQGNELPAGPYFYSIELDGGKKKYRGTVTILK